MMKQLLLSIAVLAAGIFSGCKSNDSTTEKTNDTNTNNNTVIKKEYKSPMTPTDTLFAEMKTSKGTILLMLEAEKTPLTVANFVGLAEGTISNTAKPLGTPYYDGITFHRVIPDFMI